MKKGTLLLCLLLCFALPGFAAEEALPIYTPTQWAGSRWHRQQFIADLPCFDGAETVEAGRDELLPVYAAPSEDAWRGAKGRAAVSLAEPFTALAWSEDGEWLLIDYQVDGDSRRIGYIRRPEGLECGVPVMHTRRLTMGIWTDKTDWKLTDDPNGTQRRIAAVGSDDTVTVLGWTSDAWAYVETSLDGKAARLFLPLAALDLPDERPDPAMTEALRGAWVLAAGGSLLGDGAVFNGYGRVSVCETDLTVQPPVLTVPRDGQTLYYRVLQNLMGDERYPGCSHVLEVAEEANFWQAERFGLRFTKEDRAQGRPAQIDLVRDDGEVSYLLAEDARLTQR